MHIPATSPLSIASVMVVFDLPTLLAITVFTSGLAGCLLLLSWLQHRRIFALALWGSAFIIAAIATTLIYRTRHYPGLLVDCDWKCDARRRLRNHLERRAQFRRQAGIGRLDSGRGVIWLAACSIGPIYALPAARATVMAAIAITYALLAVLELWRGRGEDVWRWPIMLLLLGHAAAIPIRIPLAGSATDPNSFNVDLLTFALFETVFVCICAAYLFGGLAKDRVAARYQRASLIDPLTGVANRRGFLQAGERLMVRTRFARRPVALLLFDLEHFKSINDKFGHGAGDAVLIAFCQLATSQLGRPIYSAGSGVRSSRACYRIRRSKTPSGWQNGCARRSKPPPARSQSDRLS